jgi:2-hydroxy-3-keto-5-methylthiopentenyl-1-phosphate phosphatase
MAQKADLVLAKGVLAEHCSSVGLDHLPFDNFTEATALLTRWLETANGPRGRATLLETEHA